VVSRHPPRVIGSGLQNGQPSLYFEPIICGNIGKSVSMS
jgi:hypothetical protein